MHKDMTIDEFHTLLTAEPLKNDSLLLTALRKLTAIEKPEDITSLAEEDVNNWTAWFDV